MVNTKMDHKYIKALTKIFGQTSDKREANVRSRQLLCDMAGDPSFFTSMLQHHLSTPKSLNKLHYPVVSFNVELNPYYHLVAHCWIPLPDGNTNVSTKAIHHHGDMLLSTATVFGPGYEHWTFTCPKEVDAERELYTTTVLERSPHTLHNVAFVDSYIAHVPFYPPSLTITYALWSSQFSTTWRDHVKRIPMFQNNSRLLRRLAIRVGLKRQLELKASEYLDFYPACDGLRGMRERKEFALGPNEDYLASLFHIIQQTGNASLASLIREKLAGREAIVNQSLVEQYVTDLEQDHPVKGRLSPTHYGVVYANFSKEDVNNALAMQAGQ